VIAQESSAEPRLRGHHFICLQFFRGQGYGDEFVANLTDVVGRAQSVPALLVEGADDVCAACPSVSSGGKCLDPHSGEAEIRRIDRLALEILGVGAGERLTLAEAREHLAADAIGAGNWRFEACAGCTWEDTCEHEWDELLGDV